MSEIKKNTLGELTFNSFEFTAQTLLLKEEKKQLVLNPEYQRQYVWGNMKASKLIESCIIKIPLPNIYLHYTGGKYEVIDGVQRLTSVLDYMKDKFPLSDLNIYPQLNDKKYSQLEAKFQTAIEDYAFRCIVLREDSDTNAVREIFKRLNSGGIILSPQETRHALYPSLFDRLLDKLGQKIKPYLTKTKLELRDTIEYDLEYDQETEEIFETEIKLKKITKRTTKIDRKSDEESVLRFFAFCYKKNFENYKNKTLEKYLDEIMEQYETEKNIVDFENMFDLAFENCKAVFGENIFKGTGTGIVVRKGFAFFDIQMYGLSKLTKEQALSNKDIIYNNYFKMCKDKKFIKSFAGGSSNYLAMKIRRDLWDEYISSQID